MRAWRKSNKSEPVASQRRGAAAGQRRNAAAPRGGGRSCRQRLRLCSELLGRPEFHSGRVAEKNIKDPIQIPEDFDDSAWTLLDVPHDLIIGGEYNQAKVGVSFILFDHKANAIAHGASASSGAGDHNATLTITNAKLWSVVVRIFTPWYPTWSETTKRSWTL